MSRQSEDLAKRLYDLAAVAESLFHLVEEHAEELPAILLSRLHVEMDSLAARLNKVRLELQDAWPKK
jgi:hypothetical protein